MPRVQSTPKSVGQTLLFSKAGNDDEDKKPYTSQSKPNSTVSNQITADPILQGSKIASINNKNQEVIKDAEE